MILGIGTDLTEIPRMLKAMKRTPALEKSIFTQAEQDYCQSKACPEQSFAACFAGKEAVLKALGCGVVKFPLTQLEICHEKDGKPFVKLYDDLALYAESKGIRQIEISLSHSGDYAIAFVIATDDKQKPYDKQKPDEEEKPCVY